MEMRWMHNTPSLSTRENKGLHWDSSLEVLRKMERESEEFKCYLQSQVHPTQNWAMGPSNGHLIGLRLKRNSCTKLDVECREQVRQKKIKVSPMLIIKTTQWTLNLESVGNLMKTDLGNPRTVHLMKTYATATSEHQIGGPSKYKHKYRPTWNPECVLKMAEHVRIELGPWGPHKWEERRLEMTSTVKLFKRQHLRYKLNKLTSSFSKYIRHKRRNSPQKAAESATHAKIAGAAILKCDFSSSPAAMKILTTQLIQEWLLNIGVQMTQKKMRKILMSKQPPTIVYIWRQKMDASKLTNQNVALSHFQEKDRNVNWQIKQTNGPITGREFTRRCRSAENQGYRPFRAAEACEAKANGPAQ